MAMRTRLRVRWALAITGLVVGVTIATGGVAEANLLQDFGTFVETLLKARSFDQFGVLRPLDESSARSISEAEAQAQPLRLVTLAGSLQARVITSTPLALNIDMIALWPDDSRPTHLIACNEADETDAPDLSHLQAHLRLKYGGPLWVRLQYSKRGIPNAYSKPETPVRNVSSRAAQASVFSGPAVNRTSCRNEAG
jgi:hypothetical protein